MSTTIQLSNEANTESRRVIAGFAQIAIASTIVALVCLVSLHFLSPEFDPSWRMVSEYALGNYSWVLSVMFLTWAIGAWTLAYALRNEVRTIGGKIGIFFLVLAGIGEAMAAIFDVQHSLHGVAATIGMPSLPIAAILISVSLKRNESWNLARKKIMLTTHLTWISILLMTITVMILFDGFKKAGVDMSSGKPPETLPEGVIALAGWANRFLIICYCLWAIQVGTQLKKIMKSDKLANG